MRGPEEWLSTTEPGLSAGFHLSFGGRPFSTTRVERVVPVAAGAIPMGSIFADFSHALAGARRRPKACVLRPSQWLSTPRYASHLKDPKPYMRKNIQFIS
jgi:hypothetical protein